MLNTDLKLPLQQSFAASQQLWKRLLLLHIAIASVGLIKLSLLAGSHFYDIFFSDFAISKLGTAGLDKGAQKLGRFLEYAMGLGSLFIFYIAAFGSMGRLREISFGTWRSRFIVGFFVIQLIFTLALWHYAKHLSYWVPLWMLFALFPFTMLTQLPSHSFSLFSKKIYLLLLTAILTQTVILFYPFVTKPFAIANEYIDIPGETRLNNGEWVDNTQFININKIGGIHKYDPRIDTGITLSPESGTFVKIHHPQLLPTLLDSLSNDKKSLFIFYPETQRLAVKGEISAEDNLHLKYALTYPQDQKAIDQLLILSLNQKNFFNQRIYTPIQWDFIQKNKIELTNQERIGWFFYHHHYFFAPIYAMVYGDSDTKPVMLYGWFTTLLFAKILPYVGGINYQSYFRVLFSFYPLYLLSFSLLLWVVFKRVEYVLIGMTLGLASIFHLGFEVLQLGVGLNPLRHLFDVYVFLTFYLYITRSKIFWLILSLTLCLVTLLFNKEFGIFLLFAITMTEVFYQLKNPQRHFSGLYTIAFFLIMGCGLFLTSPGSNPQTAYMLLGEGTPGASTTISKVLLLINAFLYLLCFTFTSKHPINRFWLAPLFYCQGLLIYFIWYPEAHHLIGIAVPLILVFLCIIFLSLERLSDALRKNILSSLLLGIFVFLYIPQMAFYYWDQYRYRLNFASHHIYQWSFPTMQIQSTMNPALFTESVQLIQKYVAARSIYLISKYECILPVLAEKYNAMPYPELLTTLITPNDIQTVIATISTQKPLYLFVDSDIERNINSELIHPNDPLAERLKVTDLGRPRKTVLNRLTQLFLGIKEDYIPIEKGKLITVYKRVG